MDNALAAVIALAIASLVVIMANAVIDPKSKPADEVSLFQRSLDRAGEWVLDRLPARVHVITVPVPMPQEETPKQMVAAPLPKVEADMVKRPVIAIRLPHN